MKNKNDILVMNNDKIDLDYTGVGDDSSKRKNFFTKTLPKIVDDIQTKTFGEILERPGLEFII